jgi:hypothetical protein
MVFPEQCFWGSVPFVKLLFIYEAENLVPVTSFVYLIIMVQSLSSVWVAISNISVAPHARASHSSCLLDGDHTFNAAANFTTVFLSTIAPVITSRAMIVATSTVQ